MSRLAKRDPLYLVGGAIRNALKYGPSAKTSDFDFITRRYALKTAKAFAKALRARLIVLDRERKIYRVIVHAKDKVHNFDFAAMQGSCLEEDLKNRDLTVNAMAIAVTDHADTADIIDPTGGRQDLRKNVIRAISHKNLRSDPLRLLRVFRFAAQLDSTIDSDTLRMVKDSARLIKRPAGERLRTELLHLLTSPQEATRLKEMDRTRLLCMIFPELERARDLARSYYPAGGVLGHVIDSVAIFERNLTLLPQRLPHIGKKLKDYFNEPLGGFPRYATLKLAVLVHDIAKPHTAKVIDGRMRFFRHEERGARVFKKRALRLRLSTQETELIAKIIRAHLRPGNLAKSNVVTERAFYKFFKDLGPDGIGTLCCALSDHQSYMTSRQQWSAKEPAVTTVLSMIEKYWKQPQRVTPKKLIDGHDIMRTLKIAPGPLIGKILDEVHALQAEGSVKTRSQALSAIKNFANNKLCVKPLSRGSPDKTVPTSRNSC